MKKIKKFILSGTALSTIPFISLVSSSCSDKYADYKTTIEKELEETISKINESNFVIKNKANLLPSKVTVSEKAFEANTNGASANITILKKDDSTGTITVQIILTKNNIKTDPKVIIITGFKVATTVKTRVDELNEMLDNINESSLVIDKNVEASKFNPSTIQVKNKVAGIKYIFSVQNPDDVNGKLTLSIQLEDETTKDKSNTKTFTISGFKVATTVKTRVDELNEMLINIDLSKLVIDKNIEASKFDPSTIQVNDKIPGIKYIFSVSEPDDAKGELTLSIQLEDEKTHDKSDTAEHLIEGFKVSTIVSKAQLDEIVAKVTAENFYFPNMKDKKPSEFDVNTIKANYKNYGPLKAVANEIDLKVSKVSFNDDDGTMVIKVQLKSKSDPSIISNESPELLIKGFEANNAAPVENDLIKFIESGKPLFIVDEAKKQAVFNTLKEIAEKKLNDSTITIIKSKIQTQRKNGKPIIGLSINSELGEPLNTHGGDANIGYKNIPGNKSRKGVYITYDKAKNEVTIHFQIIVNNKWSKIYTQVITAK
ncbi:lipoprotein 17-related variable surface protein [Mycoplasmopsis adleri]|uniref:lipoprotein 17-related variable surface protein n=1 Tax=Mycoplasmopsis adleri TaxID=51362 RepID=UPI0038734A4A